MGPFIRNATASFDPEQPVFFITDDHDYFDNDDATPERVTFPPDEAERALPGQREEDGIKLSTHFGSLRYGDLCAGLLYDCGGYLGLGEGAGLVPPRSSGS